MMESFVDAFKEYFIGAYAKYATFSGRARRKEYWMFILFYIITYIALLLIDVLIGTGGILCGLFALGTLLPSLAVGARRLHDINKSGWWQLLYLIPFGGLVVLYFLVSKGTEGENRFGSDPLAE
jgi:uncharacterized membrane protein YhaH (DUF805 family)